MKRTSYLACVLVGLLVLTSGCSNMSARQKGFLQGAAVGAAIGGGGGAAIGSGVDNSNRDNGAAIGAVSGALVGGVIGALMAKEPPAPEKPCPPPAPKVEAPAPPPPPAPKVELPPPPPVKERIVLRGINFDFDKSDIKKEFVPVLEEAAKILKNHPNTTVVIEGHTDAIGTDKYNQGLSERRANSVKKFLISRGIPASQLETIGYGKSKPIADNKTAAGRAMNRRVEFKVKNGN
jgi:outer membrane protein OmpA-like peptidoglycan-associated protein